MNRRDASVALLSLFGASGEVSGQGRGAKSVFPGSPLIRGDLSLLHHKEKPFQGVGDRIALVYFGTAQSLPICATDLDAIEHSVGTLNQHCSKPVVPLFVYPHGPGIPGDGNLRKLAEKPGSPFIVLSGPLEHVLEVAKGYKARYFFDRPSGSITNHSRFAYAMAPDGRNLATVKSADLLPHALKELASYLNEGSGQKPVCSL